ncbi:MFS transporter [Sphingobium sufflavum]|uniref:MFS transporter n=1 Tax=Sphingobium sufflavum TaxID=1129547 RepID=UPI001F1B31E0|nr:MFS transporter [Sphingobium sufflavum]MCE7798896.1 MFS transporter [Sphingobium sufflavum]
MAGTPLSVREEWKRHWPLVIAACIGFSFMSAMTPAIGVFMDPLTKEFGWTRTQLSAGIAISAVISLFASPFFGLLIDRLGTRRIAMPGIVLTACAIAALSLANGSFPQWIILWLVWGLMVLLIQSTVWSTAVASVFESGRGLALGLTLSGTALAQIVVPPLANWLIGEQGWRMAFVTLGFGWGSLALLLSFLFLYDARDRLRLKSRFAVDAAADGGILPGLTIAQAWRSPPLWRVFISTFLILTITIAVSVHQFPILTEAGVSRAQAAWFASLAGMAGVVGKLVTGALIDRVHARWVGGITLASTAIAYPLLIVGAHTPHLILIAIMISGYAAGTKIQLCGYLTARYGGMRNYGAIFGFMTSAIALASGLGPLFAGLSFDHYGSYSLLLVTGTIVSLISGLLVLSLGRYPDWHKSETSA